MKLKEALEILIHFFNEIIAHVLPGAILILSASYIFEKNDLIKDTGLHWALIIGVSFLAGHAILSLNRWIERTVCGVQSFQIPNDLKVEFTKYFSEFSKLKNSEGSDIEISNNMNDMFYRNIAMSISPHAGELGRRFMFISLFCKGTGTSIGIIYIMIIIKIYASQTLCDYWCQLLVLAVAVAFIIYIMEYRAAEFFRMAMEAPFSVAIVEMINKLKFIKDE